jgi:hypothetical protein
VLVKALALAPAELRAWTPTTNCPPFGKGIVFELQVAQAVVEEWNAPDVYLAVSR